MIINIVIKLCRSFTEDHSTEVVQNISKFEASEFILCRLNEIYVGDRTRNSVLS